MKSVFGILLITLSTWARTAPSSTQNHENTAMARLIEQILNTIDQSSIDVNIHGLTLDSKAEKPVRTDNVEINGMVSFSADWQMDLVNPKEDAKESTQMKKVHPKVQADANKLKMAVDIKMVPDSTSLETRFYSHYDKTAQQWVARPLTVKLSNQMNKELLTIRLYSLKAVKKQSAGNPEVEEISGTCQSDKVLLDFTTGLNRRIPVECKFSGKISEKDGLKIQFQYADK